MDTIDQIMRFESGELDQTEVIELFQDLIDSGQVWHLHGTYGKQAMSFIEAGLCTLGPNPVEDVYGSYIPSKYEVKPGTKGSDEYVNDHNE